MDWKISSRLLLVSDTHGGIDRRILDLCSEVDGVVHAGDIGRHVQALIEAECPLTCFVAGNNDPEDSPLPRSQVLELMGGLLAVEHGDRFPAKTRHARLRAAYSEARAVVCGHGHRQVVDRQSTPWVLNPGAAGRVRSYGGPGCILLTCGEQAWQVDARRFSLPAQLA